MNYPTLNIDDINTWPQEIISYLNSADGVLNQWGSKSNPSDTEKIRIAQEYDNIIYGFKKLLTSYYLKGFHCTRLTEQEIENIGAEGMLLPNPTLLQKRVESLVNDGIINQDIANQLLLENQANEDNRMNILWFCFFLPYIATQAGIERFFRSWGGEALYNSHESNPITGSILNKVGLPCIVEAYVPVSGFHGHSLELLLAQRYMSSRGWDNAPSSYFEQYIIVNLPAHNIIRIIKYPETRFIELTHCDTWKPTL